MENLDFALQVLVLGFLVVIVTLFGLFGLLILFNRIFYHPTVASPEKKDTGEKKPVQQDDSLEGNRRVIAAIQAAVYQYMQTEQAHAFTGPLNIAIQPTGGQVGSSWKLMGRKELLESSLELETTRRKKKHENI